MGRVWELIDAHRKEGPYKPASLRQIADKLGVSPSTPGNWRDDKSLPERRFIPAIAELVGATEDQVYFLWLADARDQQNKRFAESRDRIKGEWETAIASRDNPPKNSRESLSLTVWDRQNKRLYTTREAFEAGILSIEEAEELGLNIPDQAWADAAKRGELEPDDQ